MSTPEEVFQKALSDYQSEPEDSISQYNLACCYHWGDGTSPDYVQAVKLYQKASNAGVPEATANLGLLYLYGQGVPADPLKAAALLKSAAERGNVAAMAALGGILASRRYLKAFGDNPQLGIEWLEKAAEHDDPVAIHNLGLAYVTGVGVRRNMVKGVSLLRKSASLGNELSIKTLEELNA